jgi:hypothetical protein
VANKKTHCKRGHEFTIENTQLVYEDGYEKKKCRACHLERMRKRQNYTGKGSMKKFKKHCFRGHPFTEKNTYIQLQNGIQTRKCRICRAQATKKWRKKNKKHVKDYHKKNYPIWEQKQRRICLTHYGNGKLECICCGEKIYQFLTLGHVNDNGQEERRMYNGQLGIMRRLIKLGFPEGYETVCWNCNLGKRSNKGICPHKALK